MIRRWLALTTAALLGAVGALTAVPASADFDVYTTPGTHTVNGRQWKTDCSMYSSNVERCTTDIWATTIRFDGRAYVQSNGWVFNNLTYKESNRTTWQEWNPLVTRAPTSSTGAPGRRSATHPGPAATDAVHRSWRR
ncbi:hypothetical protein G7085_00845 [Tessaracoccus sp. HDW20]|uniref:hypothetical protein n=1 Tax=Tessaracoccus coleopterorum TaxID=2714950 RepID=UPI0018D2C5E9|nr:hypothetical protein [Tessaracoccus coleopterorum]NHB83737.1 hypothetical protein [Tessaracoccus coleopterorum]